MHSLTLMRKGRTASLVSKSQGLYRVVAGARNFPRSQSLLREGMLGIFPSPRASIEEWGARNFPKSQSLPREGKFGIFPSAKVYIGGGGRRVVIVPKPQEKWRNMGKYDKIWRKYERNSGPPSRKGGGDGPQYRKRRQVSSQYIGRRTWKNSGPSSRRGESYADTIPEMAPSTEREGGSPAKNNDNNNNDNNRRAVLQTATSRKKWQTELGVGWSKNNFKWNEICGREV